MNSFQRSSQVNELAHQVQFLKGRLQDSLAKLEELQQTIPKAAAKTAAGTRNVLPVRIQQQEREVLERLKMLARVQGQLGQALMED